MCEKCEKTKGIIEGARIACQITGRMDLDRVLFDIQEEIDKA